MGYSRNYRPIKDSKEIIPPEWWWVVMPEQLNDCGVEDNHLLGFVRMDGFARGDSAEQALVRYLRRDLFYEEVGRLYDLLVNFHPRGARGYACVIPWASRSRGLYSTNLITT